MKFRIFDFNYFIFIGIFALFFSYNVGATEVQKPKILDLDLAKKMAAKAQEYAIKNKWKVAVAIVDASGHLLYFERNPESYVGSVEASQQKAKSSNAFQRPTSAFVQAMRSGKSGVITIKDVVAIEGGLPITLEGKHVGAIGVSGATSTDDELCAKASFDVLQ